MHHLLPVLCDKCEAIRLEEMKEIEIQRNTKDQQKPSELKSFAAALKDKTRTIASDNELNNAVIADVSLPSTPSRLLPSPPTCKLNDINNLCTDFAQCFLCRDYYHLNCAGLKKIPAKSTKWTCSMCKDLPGQIKELRNIVTSLVLDQVEIKKENRLLKQELKELTSKISILEQPPKPHTNGNNTVPEEAKDAPKETSITKSILIGDSMFRDVKPSAFPHTTVDCMRVAHISDIEQAVVVDPDLQSYSNVILHVGTNDIGGESKPIVSNMEHLITNLQIKAPEAKIHVSSICPRRDKFDKTVSDVNKCVKSLTERLDCSYIDNESHLRFMDGSVDTTAFHDNVHLNRKGTGKFVRCLQSAVFKTDRNNFDNVNSKKIQVNGLRVERKKNCIKAIAISEQILDFALQIAEIIIIRDNVNAAVKQTTLLQIANITFH